MTYYCLCAFKLPLDPNVKDLSCASLLFTNIHSNHIIVNWKVHKQCYSFLSVFVAMVDDCSTTDPIYIFQLVDSRSRRRTPFKYNFELNELIFFHSIANLFLYPVCGLLCVNILAMDSLS